MIKLIFYTNFLLLSLFIKTSELRSQNILHVAERRIEKQFKTYPNEIINIVGSKAQIKINGWAKEEVKLIMQFTASNADKAIAEKELEYAKYSIFKEANEIEIQNTFVIPGSVSKIGSIITVSYEVWVPQRRLINIVDNYGDISLSNLDAKFKIKLDMGNLFIDNIGGEGEMRVSYGDITGSKIKGDWNFIISRTNLNVDDAGGSYYIHSVYGKIFFSTHTQLEKLEVDAARTEINLSVSGLSNYNLSLNTSYSEIVVFNDEYKKIIKSGIRGSKSLTLGNGKSTPQLKVSTTYSPIIINKIK